ncbi:DNA-binding transcription factor yap1 [Fusarium torreyae]|uniref:DNA-binding transcription factor yap1 n=1 Tax=Fusarium torreyae TaxID=1237075 RepID=A0A9W8RYZ6_9HYPO|nr:DNA-binding transcription factor yap1 [Fusarium torreyae]
MASTGTGGTLPPNFLLTPQQQNLLFAALNSNKQQLAGSPAAAAANNPLSLSPSSFRNAANQQKPAAASGYQESPFLDNYDYDFGDSGFDFSFASEDQPSMIGDLPSANSDPNNNDGSVALSDSPETESPEKRSHPDDEDDEDSPGQDHKRRESTDKVPKKPGRKPLTSEPSSKRKAQNRAAQRAFRERKEKHLKDLETKVEELEKASQAANHENGLLRAQVERMTSELNQYKQKVSVMSTSKALPREKVPFGSAAVSNLGDVNFQFEFPKFGMLPGPPVSKPQGSGSSPTSPNQQKATYPSPTNSNSNKQSSQQFKDDLAKFSGVFSPSMSSSATNPSRASIDSANYSVNGGTSSSPSASSHSNTGPSSSCGTSPEPFNQSPMGFKPVDTMTTIGEEQTHQNTGNQFSNIDLSSTNFDWLAQQNGGQFDPQLFGDYREPQDNVLANPSFDDFFNDALDGDFFTPYNMAPTSPNSKMNAQHKKAPNLIDQIDAQKDSCDDEPLKKQNMNCNQLWEKLQACPKAQNGEFDLDGLCSELTKKAKCSGTGPVVAETDFDTILQKYMGKDVSSSCVAQTLGVEIKANQPNQTNQEKHLGLSI